MSNIIKASNIGAVVGSTSTATRTGAGQSGHRGSDSSEITLHRNAAGDVEAIEIVCSCGQTTFVECVYPNQENAS